MKRLPLEGIRVVDVTVVWAWPRPWNRSPAFNSHARHKLSMSADMIALR